MNNYYKGPPQLIVIAGPNGSGKSTVFPAIQNVEREDWSLEPVRIKNENFVNPDNIASKNSLSKLAAGRKTISRIKKFIELGENFAIETTLSGKTMEKYFQLAKQKGYKIYIIFLSLRSSELSMNRVSQRALLGEHYIPMKQILKRYDRSLDNFFNIYKKYADPFWVIADNSTMEINVLYWGLFGDEDIYSSTKEKNYITKYINLNKLRMDDSYSPLVFNKIKQKIEIAIKNRPDGNYVSIQEEDEEIIFLKP